MKRLSIACTLFTMLVFPSFALAGVPLDTVKANAESVLKVPSDPKLQGEAGKKIKQQKIEEAADKLFDFIELSKRTLGLQWNKFSDAQRREFVSLFKSVLRSAYISKITAYTNEKVDFTKEVPLSQNMVEVQSVVKEKNADVPINYRVIKVGNDWKVYDVVIEGVSLISNYQTQFRDILSNGGPEKLLDTLRNKPAAR